MGEPERKRMTVEEFFAWQLKQDKLYELVDGFPLLPLKMMAGASSNHDRAVVNAIGHFFAALRGKPCRPTTDDVATAIPKGNIRRPDLTIECGSPGPRDLTAAEPRIVLEVLSPSTLSFDRFRKLEEYKTVPSLKVILLVDTESPTVTVHRRTGAYWEAQTLEGLDAVIELPEIEARLALRDLFEGVVFASANAS